MNKSSWNPWKLTAIGLALVMATAVVTGMVVASWNGTPSQPPAATPPPATPPAKVTSQPTASPHRTSVASAPAAPAAAAPASAPAPARAAVPSEATIEACNRIAAGQPTTKDKTVEVAKVEPTGVEKPIDDLP